MPWMQITALCVIVFGALPAWTRKAITGRFMWMKIFSTEDRMHELAVKVVMRISRRSHMTMQNLWTAFAAATLKNRHAKLFLRMKKYRKHLKTAFMH